MYEKNICIIPARGGSKRIPRKNIKDFHGLPIIAYSIKHAIDSGCFHKVIVSSDDEEIIDTAQKYGADTPYIRPSELSNDDIGLTDVILHAINWEIKHNTTPEYVCCLLATAPFADSNMLLEAYNLLKKEENKLFCFGVSKFNSPVQRGFRISSDDKIEMLQPEFYLKQSQEMESIYHDAGQFYWGKVEGFLNKNKKYSEHSIPYFLPKHTAIDIDCEEDWLIAEAIYSQKNLSK